MLTFIIGLMVGGIIGFFVMCLLSAARDSDRYAEMEEREWIAKVQSAETVMGGSEVTPDDPL